MRDVTKSSLAANAFAEGRESEERKKKRIKIGGEEAAGVSAGGSAEARDSAVSTEAWIIVAPLHREQDWFVSVEWNNAPWENYERNTATVSENLKTLPYAHTPTLMCI